MKNIKYYWALTCGLCIILSFSAYGQRDTIKYFPFKLILIIKDSTIFPTGNYNDSQIVDTYNNDIDTIFKNYKVLELYRAFPNHNPPPYTKLDSVYKLICKGNEYDLFIVLSNYNINHNNKSFYDVHLVPKAMNNILNDRSNIDNLFTYNNKDIEFKINNTEELYVGIFNINGVIIRNFQKINSGSSSINIKDLKVGIYILRIIKSGKIETFKIIKL